MTILIYSPGTGQRNDHLVEAVEQALTNSHLEIYKDFKMLVSRLRKPHDDIKVAILMPAEQGELIELYANQEMLGQMKLILVLPNEEQHMVSAAHRLRPRFLAYRGGNYTALMSVVTKLAADAG